MTLRLGSLCSGYEGLGMGIAEVLDVELAWVADPDPGASAVLAHHWPAVPNLGDITKTDWSEVEPVDIVCAGFPCQDISYAGRGEGIQEGNRSGLWHTIADALAVLRPRFVVLENVSAIVARRPGLDVVLADLAELGFDADWTCVRASDVGAPHRRERWFLVATDTGRDAVRQQPVAESGSGRTALAEQHSLAADADRGGLERHPERDVAQGAGLEAPSGDDPDGRVLDWGQYGPAIRRWERIPGRRTPADTEGESPRGGGRGDRTVARPSRQATEGRQGGGHEPASRPGGPVPAGAGAVRDWGVYGPAIARWGRVLGRPAPDPTEVGPRGNRRLNPAFVEWMQGLPAGHVTAVPALTRSQMLKLLGNGVVPQQGAHALPPLLVRAEVAA